MLRNKPDWTQKSRGASIQSVVHVKNAREKDTKSLLISRNAVSVLKPGRSRVEPEDEFVVDACFGQDTTATDIVKNTIKPLVSKVVEGYNVYVLVFGASDTSKTVLLEGDAEQGREGLVEVSGAELFRTLGSKNKQVLDYLSSSSSTKGSKSGFDFFVETAFSEVYNEKCKDLYSDEASVELLLAEDANEGFRLQGQVLKNCSDARELSSHYKQGCDARDRQITDIGNSEERTSTVFSISVDQLLPPGFGLGRGASSTVTGAVAQQQVHLKSKLVFVNMAGAERLLMDPDVLRAREGVTLNKSLLCFASCLRRLSNGEASDFLAEESSLTRMIQDALGGNSHTLLISTLKTDSQRDWQQNITTMRYASTARRVRNFPCINDNMTRTLFKQFRSRLIHLKDQRENLSNNLKDVPAFGDVDTTSAHLAKIHQLERLLLEEKERSADLLEETHAMQHRLNDSAKSDQELVEEKVQLQESLIKSEEERLEIAKALIDFQVEHNQGISEAEKLKFDLEKRVLELETQSVEREVKEGEQERAKVELQGQAAKLEEEKSTYQSESEKLSEEIVPLRAEMDSLRAENEEYKSKSEEYESAVTENKSLQSEVSQKATKIEELQSDASDLHRELDRLRNELSLMRLERDQAQENHVKQLEGLFQEVSELNRFVRLSYTDPDSEVVKARGIASPHALSEKSEELLKALEDMQIRQHKSLRTELESVQQRYGDLARRFRSIYRAYRELRYRFEEGEEIASSPNGHAHVVMHEDDICKGDEPLPPGEAHLRREILEAEEKIIKLERQLKKQEFLSSQSHMNGNAARLREADVNPLPMVTPSRNDSAGLQKVDAAGTSHHAAPQIEALTVENDKLRSEIEMLKSKPPNTPEDKVRRENEVLHAQLQELEGSDRTRVQLSMDIIKLKAEIDQLRQSANTGTDDLQRQVREFTMNTQAELETEIASLESRCAMAEEQLNSTNRYWAQASVAYQKEIMRLRAVVGRYDPGALQGEMKDALASAGLPQRS